MNVYTTTLIRTMAIAVLAAIGMATAISSCGGGSSGSEPPPQPPASDLMVIHANNAHDISSALITAVGLTFDISDLTGGNIPGQFAVGATRLEQLLWDGGVAMQANAAAAAGPDDCPFGGTVYVTAILANPNTLTVGDQITADFDYCDEGDGYVLDGLMVLTVAAIDGDIFTDVFLLGLDMTLTDMSVIEGEETVVINADMTLTLDTLDFPVIMETLEGARLSMTDGSETMTFSNFEHVFEVDIGVVPEAVTVTVSGRLSSVYMGGAIDYATTAVIRAFGDDDPYTGQILITGDGSTVRIVIVDSTSVRLEVDTDADGVIDHYIDTTFAALMGDPSMSNDSTALAIAQEVMHASTGFGMMAALPARQFFDTEPFDQVKDLGLSGDFGPLELACGDSGTAVVSGDIATAGTFTAEDTLSATFAGCSGDGNNMVTGQMDILVSSFTEEPDDTPGFTAPFHFVGTVTSEGLESVTAYSMHIGSGTLELDYDLDYFQVAANGFSPSLTVSHMGVTNTISDAGVGFAASPDYGSATWFEGRLVSDRLEGAYSYQTFLSFDGLPGYWGPGPTIGDLLITADDGSTVRIVVVDQSTVRLDIDYEGDSFVDDTVMTTWAELLQ